MAGLISSTTTPVTSSGSLTTANGVTSINPAQITQTQDWQNTADQTVAGQLSTITASNSPLMQQARTRATQGMNGRGLVNSSMATGAADSAMYDAAMPIAQSDAAQASKVAGYNVDTRNTASLRNMEASNWAAGVNAGQYNDFSKIGVNQSNQQSNMRLASDLSMGQAAQQQGFDLAKMDKNAALTLQQMTEQQRNNIATMAAQQGYNLQTMNAQQINDLAKMDKNAALTLSQMTAQQQNDLAKMAASQGYNLQTMNAQQINDLAKMAQNQQFNLQTLDRQQQFQGGQAEMDRQQQKDVLGLQQGFQHNEAALDRQQKTVLAEQQIQGQKDIVKSQTDAAKELAITEAEYKTITQGSSAASSIMQNMQAALTSLMNSDQTKSMTPEQYKAYETQIRQNARDALTMIGQMAGNIDLGTYLADIDGAP